MATQANEWLTASSSSGTVLRVKELEEQQRALLTSTICAFNQMLDLRDLGTGIHSTRLAEWAVRVARKLGTAESDFYQLETAALLHDVGKIGVPDAILKKEGKLTDEERSLMNKHPEYSWSILRLFPGLDKASLYALHHHESYDGRG
jgi:HD-GYP domain-containing protein (c-di-GMP phosphodiesterase class II)